MESKVIKKRNRFISMVFDGMTYVFNDSFSGVIAIAKRDKINGNHFVIEYGNSHNYYPGDNKADLNICKAEITKYENQHVRQHITFTEVEINCNETYYCTIDIQRYK